VLRFASFSSSSLLSRLRVLGVWLFGRTGVKAAIIVKFASDSCSSAIRDSRISGPELRFLGTPVSKYRSLLPIRCEKQEIPSSIQLSIVFQSSNPKPERNKTSFLKKGKEKNNYCFIFCSATPPIADLTPRGEV